MPNPHREAHRMIQRTRIYRNASRRNKIVMMYATDAPSRITFHEAVISIAEAAHVVNDALKNLTDQLRKQFTKET